MNISVIVSTYNSPDYLGLVLDGLMNQTDDRFELIVADDGSGPETAAVVASYAEKRPIIHSWQEDRGFRLAASRNLALSVSSGDWIAFLDGDCIPSPDYVADFNTMATRVESGGKRAYIQGHRVILGKNLSRDIRSASGIFTPGWIARKFSGMKNVKNAVRWPCPIIYRRSLAGVRGCSMGFSVKDLREINGFDEEFEGWGHEDKDVVSRLYQAGATRADARGRMIVYHLYHPEHDRFGEDTNLRRAQSGRPVVAVKGLQSRVE